MVSSDKTTFVWSLSIIIFGFGATSTDVIGLSTNCGSTGSSLVEATTNADGVLSERRLDSNYGNCTGLADSCKNGGKCVNDVCQCLFGTQGDWCNVVDGCRDYYGNSKCGEVSCEFNQTSLEPYCRCKEPGYLFDSYDKICKECDCGRHGSCSFLDDKKTCDCEEGYVEKPASRFGKSQCEQCDCGPNGICSFPEGVEKVCDCQKGYVDKNGYCTECDCGGNNAGCQFLPGGEKHCYCDPTYSQKDGKCIKCDCGENSSKCFFQDDDKICSCQTNYIQYNGTCRKNCTGLADSCKNGGMCVNGTCQCLSGTQGDWCDVVDGCRDYYGNPKCGDGGDVSCEFNVTSKEPYCQCKEPGYLFDSYNKICRECDCGRHGTCFFLDSKKTCNCEEGYVEKPAVEHGRSQCVQCNCGPNGVCSFVEGGKKVCTCRNGYLDKNGYCIECDCGPNGECFFDEKGSKACNCQSGYSDKNSYCVDCDCGGNNVGCHFLPGGEKSCYCNPSYSQNGGKCEKCDCGEKSTGCSFQNREKICSCYTNYIQFNETCKRSCMGLPDPCTNGGKCVNGVCQCLSGTQGDWCDVVDGCRDYYGNPKCGDGGDVSCEFNQTSKEPYCRCKEPGYLFDSYNKICKECDCGKHGSCFFLDSKKTCDCEEGYAEKSADHYSKSQCEQCDCGPRGICSFAEGGKKVCNCQNGYLDKNGYCVECDCGPKGVCSFAEEGGKVCYCQIGYSYKDGYCIECNCGPNGACLFDEGGQKVCDCLSGFSDKKGYCTECDCGAYGECEWNDYEEKTCNCKEGYGVKDGKCTECTCFWEDLKTNCTFFNGRQKCTCPDGYEERTEHFCLDINECEEQNKCPHRDTTECINIPGSYYCVCKSGYSSKSPKASIESEGCQKDQTGWSISHVGLSLIVLGVNALGLIIAIIKRKFYSKV